MEERTIGKIAVQLLSAVEYLHSMGIIHRDIGMSSIITGKLWEDINIKLCSFKNAKVIGEFEKCYEKVG